MVYGYMVTSLTWYDIYYQTTSVILTKYQHNITVF